MMKNNWIRNAIVVGMSACLGIVGFASNASQAAEWGTLKGKFVLDGKAPEAKPLLIDKDPECCKEKHKDESLIVGADGGIANVIIYVSSKVAKVAPEYEAAAKGEVVLDNKTCQFQPHITLLRTSQTLVVKNTDTCNHNTNITPLGDTGLNPLIASGSDIKHQFKKQQRIPIPVACNIHPWMKAYVLPRENPYFALTGADGSFEIKNLPTGELEFQVWQEKAGFVDAPGYAKGKFKKAIKAGENDLGTVKLKAAQFNK